MNIDDFIETLHNLLPVSVTKNVGKLIIQINYSEGKSKNFQIEEHFINENLNKLNCLNEFEGFILYSSNYCEKLVRIESSIPILRLDKDYEIYDIPNKLFYQCSALSTEYLIFLLNKVLNFESFFDALNVNFRLRRFCLDIENDDFFDLLRFIFHRFRTIKIKSEKNLQIEKFNDLINSFKFHISYNFNLPLVDFKYLDEIQNIRRLIRLKRVKEEDLEPPKRLYIPDLIYYYQMGLSAAHPILKFISYYNIIEYFYEKVFNEDLIYSVRDKITLPDFSYKNDRDLQDLINNIKNKVKLKEGREIFSDITALKLTLMKYIPDLDIIKKQIMEYQENLLEEYKNNVVSFSNGKKVDFYSKDQSEIYKSLAHRIYNTRNSIIHSKEQKKRYTPFHDEKELIKEIPLIRFIAETIILNSSKELI